MRFNKGDRIEITGLMQDEPSPIAVGTTGTVVSQTGVGTALEQVTVNWDVGPDGHKRTLMLVPVDYRLVKRLVAACTGRADCPAKDHIFGCQAIPGGPDVRAY